VDGSELWVGVAGTVTSFAARSLRVDRYDPQLTHGAVLTRSFVREFSETLWQSPTEQRRQLLLEPERAGVIVGGAVILNTLFEVFDLSEVVSSERDILDGLAASLLNGETNGSAAQR
jgi:exopolyphosphatase/guanosine-5'-triphosphate,3'-diphosphate pyrophosphatase